MKSNILLALAFLLPPAFIIAHATDTIDVSLPIPDSIIAITSSGSYVLTGTTSENRVVVAKDVIADITLHNVSITSATNSPFTLSPDGCEATLRLEGENTLTCTFVSPSDDDGYAGLQVEGASTLLTIEGLGALTVSGGAYGAGIGGRLISGQARGGRPGNIVINSGRITAIGGFQSAGIGGGAEGTGGNISITGGVVMAFHYGGEGDPPGIGGGWHCNAGNVSITGGTVFAYGGGPSASIGGGSSGSGGNISITGGTVVANRIGIGNNNALTPVSISGTGTTVLTNTINLADTADVGNAKVQTGVSLPLAVMQAMAANTPYGLTLHDTLLLHDTLPADTTRDTIAVHDTIYLDTLPLRDTIHLDTVSVHDTVHIDTVSIYDTVHVDTTEMHDTLHADTAFIHDTTLIVDTIFIPISVHDTTFIPVSIYDTTHTIAIVVDPTLPPETLLITDTIVHDRPVDAPTYILLEDDGSGTGLSIPVADAPLTLIPANNGNDLYYINGLDPVAPVLIYNIRGHLIAHATRQPVRIVGTGVFIVAQEGRYYKVVK